MNMPDTPRDQAFLDFRAGPSRATLTRLLEVEQHNVFNVCFHVLGRRADAEDAAQEVLLRAVEAASTVADAQHWRRWLTRASVNAALDAARAGKRRDGLAERRAAMQAARVPAADEGEALGAALAGLEDDDRSLVVGHFLEKVSLETLGRERGVSGQAIWKRLERAKERLREALTAAGCAAMVPGLRGVVPVQATRNLVSGPVAAKISAAFGVAAATAAGGVVMAYKAWTVALIAAVLLAGLLGVAIPRYREVSTRAGQAELLEERLAEESRARAAAESEVARLRAASNALSASAAGPGKSATSPTKPLALNSKANLGDRLDALVAWMTALRLEIDGCSDPMTPEEAHDKFNSVFKQRLAPLSEEFRQLRLEAWAEPLPLLERLARTDASGDLFILYLLLSGELDPANAKGFRPELDGNKLPSALVDGIFEITRTGAPEAKLAALQFFSRVSIQPAGWADHILALLDDADPRVGFAAINSLEVNRESVQPRYLGSLKRIVDSSDGEARPYGINTVLLNGLHAISRIDTPEARDYLLTRLATEKDDEVISLLAISVRELATSTGATERATLAESLRAAFPRATTSSGRTAVASAAVKLPVGEARECIIAMARTCEDENIRGRLDRLVAAMDGGETRVSEFYDILYSSK